MKGFIKIMKLNFNKITFLDKEKYIYIKPNKFTGQFNYLFKKLSNLKDTINDDLKIWSKNSNSRKNKSIYLKSRKNKLFNNKEIKFIEYLTIKTKKFAKSHGYRLNKLQRIQVIESKSVKKKLYGEDKYLYNFHVDKLNTFKSLFFINGISPKNGPFQLGTDFSYQNKQEILKILNYKKKLIKKISVNKKLNFRDLNTQINIKKHFDVVGKRNSIFIINGDWPHRASLISKNHKRKLIIFEWFTVEDSKIYKNDLKKNNNF